MKEKFMKKALELAEKGNTSPNPLVGCVIVKDNKIVGQGFHEKFGGPHAEINALKKAGKKSKGATMYVTLEPCNHYGKTPPCTNSIIKAGIKKVIVSMLDPNPLMKGKSLKQLEKKGIKTEKGLLEEKAKKINENYIKFISTKKPFVILKAAITLDGKIATEKFDSKWISSKESREKVHELRSKTDAILVGENTILKDNPRLTSRIKKGKNPLRIIITTKKLSSKLNVFKDENFLIATTRKELFKEKNFENKVLELKGKKGLVDLKKLMKELGKRNISSLFVEGGSGIFTSFVKEKLADKLMLFVSPKIFGKGIPVFGNLKIKKAKNAIQMKELSFVPIGNDVLIQGYF